MPRYIIAETPPDPPEIKPFYDDLAEAVAALDHIKKGHPDASRLRIVAVPDEVGRGPIEIREVGRDGPIP